MTNLILPKKRKLDEVEEIPLPVVKCDACGNLTTTGLHQTQLKLIKPGRLERHKHDPKLVRRIPPVMKKIDLYMCTRCVASGKKWPGDNPR